MQRQGAGAVYLNIFHPDVVEFLSTKKENADEKVRMKTLSLGLIVPDKYYELIKKNETMYLFSPHDVQKVYNKAFSEINITEEYDNMVANPNITKSKIKARDLETEISKLQQESGYPYILNIDTANRSNPIHGTIKMSNLCSEILQVQDKSELNADLSYKTLGTDISCNLGSTNIANLIHAPNFEKSVETMVRALTFVSDSTDLEEVPTVQKGNELRHTIGLGAMGHHSAMAVNKIRYESEEGVEFTDAYFRTLSYYAIKASNTIARERKESFYEFEKSKYADGTYFDKYLDAPEFEMKSEAVKKALKDVPVPSKKDWEALRNDIMKYGMYNAYLLAIAP